MPRAGRAQATPERRSDEEAIGLSKRAERPSHMSILTRHGASRFQLIAEAPNAMLCGHGEAQVPWIVKLKEGLTKTIAYFEGLLLHTSVAQKLSSSRQASH
jgi:hypothetical protein